MGDPEYGALTSVDDLLFDHCRHRADAMQTARHAAELHGHPYRQATDSIAQAFSDIERELIEAKMHLMRAFHLRRLLQGR